MTSAQSKTELLTGVFVFFGLALLVGLILQFSNIKELFRKDYPIKVTFTDSSGLAVGAPVRYGGTRIGRVETLTPLVKETDGIPMTMGTTVELKVYQEFNVPQGAKITIGKEGLLGDSFVNISPPTSPIVAALKPNDTIAGQTSGSLDDLQEAANDVAAQTQKLLRDISVALADLNSALGKLDRDILSEANLTSLRETMSGLNNSMKKIDTEVLSAENTAGLKKTIAQLDNATANLSKGSERLDGLLTKGGTAVDQLGQAAATFKESGIAFKKAAESTGKTVGDINYGSGLFNALIHDATLRQDFKNLISNLKERGIIFYKDVSDQRPPTEPRPPLAPKKTR